jgi:transcription elongation factor Elf1
MKTIFVCPRCGSTQVYIDAYSAMNWEDVQTNIDCVCLTCGEHIDVKQVEVPDDTDVGGYTHPITRDKA